MSKKNSKTVAAPIVPAAQVVKPAEPIDPAIETKQAQDTAIALIFELSDVDDRRDGIGEKLTGALIIIQRNNTGNDRDVAMRPLYDAVVKVRAKGDKNYGEKQARQYLYNYVTNARKAIESGLYAVEGASLSVRSVNEASKKKEEADKANGVKAKTKRRGRQPKASLVKVMDYLRPEIAGLKEAASAEGAYSQAVQVLMWIARECKYEAVYNGQHKTLVVTVK